jgi:hypothetical protein
VDTAHNATKLRPSPDVIARNVGTSAVLIHLNSNRIFELNATGSRVWSLLEQGLDRDTICARLQAEFDSSPDDVSREVDDLLSELIRERIICA